MKIIKHVDDCSSLEQEVTRLKEENAELANSNALLAAFAFVLGFILCIVVGFIF